ETWGLEEEEQQSDCLPSGDEILNPQSKSVPKGNVVQTASKDLVWIDNLIRDRLRRPISKRKRKHSSKLTPAELAMDDPTEEEESDEIYSPSKKKAAQKKKHQTPSTPAERAMDEDSDEDDDNTPPPKTSPSKGKRRASNSKNINPKSHSGPNSVASPFLAFEEYAKKKEDSMSLCPFTPVLNNVQNKAAERRHQWQHQRQQQWHQHGNGSNWRSAAAAAFSTVWRRHQPAAAFSTAWRQSTAAVAFTMAAAFSTAWRRHQPAEHGSSSMAAAFSTAWWRHQPAEHGMAEASTCGARHGGGINRRRHQPAEHGMAEASTGGARHGGGINRRSTAWRRHQPAEHGMAEASTGRARHGGGINRWSTAWRRHQPAEHGMAAASTGGAGRRQRKSQQAGDVLGFEKMKYDCLIAKENKRIDWEDKKFDHTKQMENKKWDHSIKLEGKKWNQGIKAKESKLKWEADEKEKDHQFEIEKMNTQTSNENKAKKLDLSTKLVESGKTMEEMEKFLKFFD
ncbi:hypothetical protein KEM48_002625, partial [Puccinia striiformis f. sp. tritici PST-130]